MSERKDIREGILNSIAMLPDFPRSYGQNNAELTALGQKGINFIAFSSFIVFWLALPIYLGILGTIHSFFFAAIISLGIVDIPIKYLDRTYGSTNIKRFRHGLMLLKMVSIGVIRIKMSKNTE